MELDIKELGNSFMLVRTKERVVEKVVIKTFVTEEFEDGEVKTQQDNRVEFRPTGKTVFGEDLYIFSRAGLNLAVRNYGLGGCSFSEKGLQRYCLAYGKDTTWYKQPGRTARQLVTNGCKIPKVAHGLLTHILNPI